MATPTHSAAGTNRVAVRWEQARIASPSGPVPARVYRPGTSAPQGWLVWAHGGSWRAGSAQDWHGATAELAQSSGFAVVSVDYRLAPEVRHPAMVEDVLSALAWVRERAGGTAPVAVGGDSAGATLAACATLACRDRALPLAAQILAYPPLDPGCTAASYHRFPDMFPTASYLAAAWQDYRQPGRPVAADGTRLHSTPFEASDLRGLAPAVMATGDLDPVSDDVHRYGRLLRAAGVEVVLREFRQTGHGAFLQPGRAPGGHTTVSLRGWLGAALRLLTSPDGTGA
ncbi:alpha/beta hydrolase [Streptomyces sp. NBC_01294]|uniref:alpha/beta hydrolase n=1 Tax=Streptomyces sp. NBC_01294 TaxID=2903815 RepID=UPI002DD9366D|nr:alpha/beta hydrolase fold domain-containing protein [Streptomyces sp. NBC_01294]WRZ60665.1 alpha/beta hydrolase [Streptomyces sp. NBC_01294]